MVCEIEFRKRASGEIETGAKKKKEREKEKNSVARRRTSTAAANAPLQFFQLRSFLYLVAAVAPPPVLRYRRITAVGLPWLLRSLSWEERNTERERSVSTREKFALSPSLPRAAFSLAVLLSSSSPTPTTNVLGCRGRPQPPLSANRGFPFSSRMEGGRERGFEKNVFLRERGKKNEKKKTNSSRHSRSLNSLVQFRSNSFATLTLRRSHFKLLLFTQL